MFFSTYKKALQPLILSNTRIDYKEFYLCTFPRKGWIKVSMGDSQMALLYLGRLDDLTFLCNSEVSFVSVAFAFNCLYASEPEILFHSLLRMQQFCTLEYRCLGFTSMFTCKQQNVTQGHFFPGTLSLKQMAESKSLKNISRTIFFPVSYLFISFLSNPLMQQFLFSMDRAI